MQGQQPVKIVVDSTADIPPEWRKQLDIGMIPAFVNFGAESYADDGVSITRTQFYERLAREPGLPGTSAPPLGIAEEVLAEQLAKAERVIAFTLSAQFSSIHNAIRVAGEHVDKARITVIDTGTVSMAAGWQALAAAEAAARGESQEAALEAAHQTRARVRLLAVIDTLEFLRRSGRINWLIANLGTLFQVKPIFEVLGEGKVEVLNRARTASRANQVLLDLIRTQAPFERVALLHSNNPGGADMLAKALADLLPSGPRRFMIGEVATGIGVHIGPGCVGIALVKARGALTHI